VCSQGIGSGELSEGPNQYVDVRQILISLCEATRGRSSWITQPLVTLYFLVTLDGQNTIAQHSAHSPERSTEPRNLILADTVLTLLLFRGILRRPTV
jgi:hypothetical protein